MKIVIPSYNRVGKVLSLDFIPESWYKQVYVTCRVSQAEEYRQSLPKDVRMYVIRASNIGETRDKICRKFAGEQIWMLDDDCIVNTTFLDKEKDMVKIDGPINSEEKFSEFMRFAQDLLNQYPLGMVKSNIFPCGIGYYPYRLNTWAIPGNMFLDLSKIDADLLDYTYVQHSEDVHAFLRVISSGYDSFLISKWLIKTLASGHSGGMTGIRNSPMITEAHEKIHERFPLYTRLREKDNPDKKIKEKVKALVISPPKRRDPDSVDLTSFMS